MTRQEVKDQLPALQWRSVMDEKSGELVLSAIIEEHYEARISRNRFNRPRLSLYFNTGKELMYLRGINTDFESAKRMAVQNQLDIACARLGVK